MRLGTEQFIELLKEKNIRYELWDENKENDCMTVFCEGKSLKEIPVQLFINDNDACITISSIMYVKGDKKDIVLNKLNELHQEYGWVRFFINRRNELTIMADTELKFFNTAAVCYQIFTKVVNILNYTYPELIKLI